ncbi:M24 family metallopeptidase [Bosea vaviloviae]|uniref:Xaa-Pro dipeptidase n=1 Tax=Bosea vaviloviae TaxID=1526658 RepID=A0A1D7UC90_9HYPH|nr:Xaa-Pro peptidase family protein [Bosea vaviloviae]AOO84977.1 hypothetical protein BHK69_30100 [Bosea vaviloviae]
MAQFASPFPLEDFHDRLRRVQEVLRARNVDWAILDEPETMGWLSGYVTSENLWRAVIVPVSGQPFLLLRSLDAAPARHRTWIDRIVTFLDWEDPIEVLMKHFPASENGKVRIGIEFQSNSMTQARVLALKHKLSDAGFVDLERSTWDLRRIKSVYEIAHMRRGSEILDQVLGEVVAAIRPGIKQREIAAIAAAAYYRLGFDDGFIGHITASTGWDSLHGFMTDEPLGDGQVVHIELLPRFKNYTVRIMRSVVLGAATDEQKDVFAQLCELQDQQLTAMKPGALASDVDAIMRVGALQRNLRPSYDNITGYTLGYNSSASQRLSDLHRNFSPKASWPIERDMVFHMYASAGGLAVSETVLVTDGGGERLTQTPRVIFEAK